MNFKNAKVEKDQQDTSEEIKEFGIKVNEDYTSNIQFISIIGEIEGHIASNAEKNPLNMNILYLYL